MEKNNMSEGKRILKLILAIIGLGILIFLIILYGFKIITIEEFILLIIFFSGIGNIILDLNKLIKGKKKIHRVKLIIVSILAIISFCLILYIKTIIPFIIIVIFGIFMILSSIVIGLSL